MQDTPEEVGCRTILESDPLTKLFLCGTIPPNTPNNATNDFPNLPYFGPAKLDPKNTTNGQS